MNAQKPVRVVIVDALPIFREGLKAALSGISGIEVVGDAVDGFAALVAVRNLKPDVIIIESAARKLECQDLMSKLQDILPSCVALITFVSEASCDIEALMRSGVRGFIAKTASTAEYQSAVRVLSEGGSFFSNSLITSLLTRSRRATQGANMFGLTARESDILRLICNGFSNKAIARRLNLSVRTVETHRFNVRKKLGAERLSDLFKFGQQLGFSEQPDQQDKTNVVALRRSI